MVPIVQGFFKIAELIMRSDTSVESVGSFDGQRVSFGVKHPFVKGYELVVAEQKVKVLESLGEEKTLLDVVLGRFVAVDIL